MREIEITRLEYNKVVGEQVKVCTPDTRGLFPFRIFRSFKEVSASVIFSEEGDGTLRVEVRGSSPDHSVVLNDEYKIGKNKEDVIRYDNSLFQSTVMRILSSGNT